MRITIDLTTQETEALRLAYEHVRVDMAPKHGWEMRDAALDAISKVLTCTSQSALLKFDHHGNQETEALRLAYEHVRVGMGQKHGWARRDAALDAIRKMITARAPMTEQETVALQLAYEHVRVDMPQEYGRTMRDAALDAISKALTSPIKRAETKDEED